VYVERPIVRPQHLSNSAAWGSIGGLYGYGAIIDRDCGSTFARTRLMRRRQDVVSTDRRRPPVDTGASTLRAALDALECQVAVLSASGHIVIVNDAWRRLTARVPTCAAQGSPGANYLDASRHARLTREARKVAQGVRDVLAHKLSGYSVEYSCDNTEQRWWFEMNAIPCDIAGAPHVIVAQRSITSTKVVEEALRAQKQRLSQIVDTIPQLVCLVTCDGKIEYCNERWRALFGESEGGLAETAIADRLHPDDRRSWLAAWRGALESGTAYDFEHRARAAEGTAYTWYRQRGSPMNGPECAIDHWLVSLLPDDERKRKEVELESLLDRKDEFFATLLHELRNPLAPISNALELLGKYPNDAAIVTRTRGIIQRQLRQVTRLVDDLLDVSRIGRGALAVEHAPVDMADVVSMAAETAKPLIDLRGHHLAVSLPPVHYWVEGDATRLSQVVTNLLINAAKYTNPGGYISVRAELTDTDVLVHVRDSGIGIAREHLDRVFELFAQSTSTPASRMGGLGIGLAVARQLVQLHGGSITARSEGIGRGSEFVISLPRAAVPPDSG
jgi:PAS domain S-box-containing protein